MSDFLVIDGFDTYTTTEDLYHKWDQRFATYYEDSDPRKEGSGYARMSQVSSYIGKRFPDRSTSFTAGAAVRYASRPHSTGAILLIEGGYDELHSPHELVWLVVQGAELKLYRDYYSDQEDLIARSYDPVIFPNTWHYVECKLKLSTYGDYTNGTYQVMVDGVIVMEGGNPTTYNYEKSYNYIHCVKFSGAHSGDPVCYTDAYIKNGYHDLYGGCIVESLFPSSSGNLSQLTPSGASSNYECVDMTKLHSESTYIYGNVGQVDLYNFENLQDFNTSIFAVCITVAGGTINAGHRYIKGKVTSAFNTEDTALISGIITTYDQLVFPTNPTIPGSPNWTESTVNSTQFGVLIYG
jgi:hypothetical protein